LVGVATFAINNLFFWIFNSYLNLNYQLSITFSYFLTVASHFLLNHFFTYSGQADKGILGAFPKYLLMLVLNYLITLSVVSTTVELLGLSPYFGIVFSTAATAMTSFLVMNHFVFRRGH
jgi:putative flippase GtrA